MNADPKHWLRFFLLQDADSYGKVITVLKDLGAFPEGAPTTVVMDFEAALMKAVQTHLPWVKVIPT